jgi:hypothetical protein
MSLDPIIIGPGQVLLQELQKGLLKLHHLAAAQAPEMGMLRMAVDMLVMPVAVGEIHFPDEAAFPKQGQDPVNGGPGDLDPFLPELQVELVHIEVAVNLKDLLEHPLPLRGAPESPPADKFLKDFQL